MAVEYIKFLFHDFVSITLKITYTFYLTLCLKV